MQFHHNSFLCAICTGFFWFFRFNIGSALYSSLFTYIWTVLIIFVFKYNDVQELAQNWPREFAKDLTCTSAFGKFQARKLYHVAIRARRNDHSDKVFYHYIV